MSWRASVPSRLVEAGPWAFPSAPNAPLLFFLFISHSSFEMQPRCPLLQEAFHLTQRKGFLSQWAVLLGSYLLHSRAIAIHCEPMGKQWLRLTLSLAGGHVFFTQACVRYLVYCPRVNTEGLNQSSSRDVCSCAYPSLIHLFLFLVCGFSLGNERKCSPTWKSLLEMILLGGSLLS